MAERETTIRFGAQDSGAKTAMDDLQKKSRQVLSSIMADAQKYTDSFAAQNRYIKEQIDLLQRRAKLESSESRQAAASTYYNKREFGGEKEQRGARGEYMQDIADIRKGEAEQKIISGYLKDILEELRGEAKEGVDKDKELVEKQIKSQERQKVEQSPEERYKTQVQRELLDEEKNKKKDGGIGI